MDEFKGSVGKLMIVPFSYAFYIASDPIGMPNTILCGGEIVFIIDITDHGISSLNSKIHWLSVKALNSKGIVGLTSVTKVGFQDFWKIVSSC